MITGPMPGPDGLLLSPVTALLLEVAFLLDRWTPRLEIEGGARPDDYPAVARADPDNGTAQPSRRRASSILARATVRMILAAQSAYISGRTGVALAGQTIMITLGLAAGSTSWMESSSAAVMWPVASTMGEDVDTVTPGSSRSRGAVRTRTGTA
jgi:hypothetical protein